VFNFFLCIIMVLFCLRRRMQTSFSFSFYPKRKIETTIFFFFVILANTGTSIGQSKVDTCPEWERQCKLGRWSRDWDNDQFYNSFLMLTRKILWNLDSHRSRFVEKTQQDKNNTTQDDVIAQLLVWKLTPVRVIWPGRIVTVPTCKFVLVPRHSMYFYFLHG